MKISYPMWRQYCSAENNHPSYTGVILSASFHGKGEV